MPRAVSQSATSSNKARYRSRSAGTAGTIRIAVPSTEGSSIAIRPDPSRGRSRLDRAPHRRNRVDAKLRLEPANNRIPEEGQRRARLRDRSNPIDHFAGSGTQRDLEELLA